MVEKVESFVRRLRWKAYHFCKENRENNSDHICDATFLTTFVAPWCSGYHCCTTSLNKAWTLVLRRFKSCSRRVEDLRWWGSLTMVPAGNKAKRLSSVNHTIKTIHHRHHHHIKNFGFKVLVTPPQNEDLNTFESDMYDMIRNI